MRPSNVEAYRAQVTLPSLESLPSASRLAAGIAVNAHQRVAVIESIATGTPEHVIPQSEAAKLIASLPRLKENGSRIEKIYQNTRIDTRHLAVNLLSEEAVSPEQSAASIQSRMQVFKEKAVPLAERVVRQALANLPDVSPTVADSLGLIVFVSSTGFIAPGVDAEIIERLGLKRNIARVTVNFMGCAAAMNGLRVACDHVRAYPANRALVVCLELSSINAVFEDDLNDVIIHSIFGDGCAAVVVGAGYAAIAKDRGQIVVRDHFSYLVEGSQDGITLGVNDTGITCQLSPKLPEYIETGVGPVIERYLASQGLTQESIDLWAVHPGGTRIIQKVQSALGLDDSQVAPSWAVLREYGNMLSASILFVLERMASERRQALSQGSGVAAPTSSMRGLGFSFSPGVGIEGVLFELA
ncbi:3-oxoacyl-[acyl-carrier-protein] synthase III C-terminal domain-containing protein [Pseudanabaena sp. FACHB-2040]|uniref:type III polyketide synthase n=1 Tax=Pseudanabaena sp. FACHB-2040 TaxID=2692859 RepID=UPI0016889CA3|nr:3-oxoacyl-[acyl-carrier-protein] synthase III C-terminal domain-containing protein [Pseudanabaena sp. FACHB-2040]MBD2256026.1 naringenin-chalcone synthase [Pseudanabaena sp. FACHB-2040]